MVNPSIIGITSILVFILLLIILFGATGHLTRNPYAIGFLILIGIILLMGFSILAYFNDWWPYKTDSVSNPNPNDNEKYNKNVLYISIAIMVLSVILLFILLYLAGDHEKKEEMTILREIEMGEITPEEVRMEEKSLPPKERKVIQEKLIETEEMKEAEAGELGPKAAEEAEIVSEERGEGIQGLQQSEIERLALENELQQTGTGLEEGSGIKIEEEKALLAQEIQQGNVNPNMAERSAEEAQLKDLEAEKAVKTMLPSRTMFGPKGSEEVMEGVV